MAGFYDLQKKRRPTIYNGGEAFTLIRYLIYGVCIPRFHGLVIGLETVLAAVHKE